MRKLAFSLMLLGLSGCGISPLNAIVDLVQRGPVPLSYPMPEAGIACAVKVSHALGTSGNWRDETMSSPESWKAEGSSYRLIAVPEIGGGISITVPDLTEGAIHHANQNTISDENKVSLGYFYSSTLADYSFEDATSKAEITIEGNRQGWTWGSFDGSLGPLRSRTLILGKFTCRSASQL